MAFHKSQLSLFGRISFNRMEKLKEKQTWQNWIALACTSGFGNHPFFVSLEKLFQCVQIILSYSKDSMI